MDSDATAGSNTAMSDDAAAAPIHGKSEVSSSSEGTTAAAVNADDRSTPTEMLNRNSKSKDDDTSLDDGYRDDSAAHETEGTPKSDDAGNIVAEASQDQEIEDAEKLIILPNHAGDHIILPSKSKQTKAETIPIEDKEAGNIHVAENNRDEQLMRNDKVSEGQYADDSKGEALKDTEKEGNSPNVDSSASLSQSTGSDSSGSIEQIEEPAAVSKEVPTNEPPVCDDAGSQTDAASTENYSIRKEVEPTSSTGEQGDGNTEADETSVGDSSESVEEEQTSSSPRSEVDDSPGPAESSTEETNGTSNSENNGRIQSEDPSATSNSSKDQELDANTSNPKGNAPSIDANETSADSSQSKQGNDSEEDGPRQIKLVDYASKLAGSQVLEQSPSLKGASNLLTGDKDRYSIAPCEDKKYVVIGLSEDILVKQIKLSNYERYSSRVKEFQVLASQEYPTPNEEYWNSIGAYTAHSKSGEQMFELNEPAWARYLKFRFLSHYGSEHYCTLSQIKVHGSTMLQGFHEQWIESEKKDMEMEQEQGQEKHGDTVQEGGEGNESELLEEEGVKNDEEGTIRGDEREGIEQPQEEMEGGSASSDLAENEDDVTYPNDAVNDSSGGSGPPNVHVDENPATRAKVEEGEMESEAVSSQNDQDAEAYIKEDSEPRQGTAIESTEKLQNSEIIALDEEKYDDRSNQSSPRANVDSQVSQNSGGTDHDGLVETDEAQFEDEKSQSDDLQLDREPPLLSSDVLEHQEDMPNVANNEPNVDQNAQMDPEDSAGEQPLARNDSSISAVTDVVKAAVVDASGVIKNATTDAIKNVKDAIRTTVASSTTGETSSKKESNNATLEGNGAENASNSDASEGDVRDELQPQVESDTAKQDSGPSSNEANKSLPPQHSTDEAQKVIPVTKGEEKSSMKADVESSSAPASFVESKHPQKKGGSSSILKEKSSEGPQDLLRREAITHVGKEDTDSMDISTKLSRRFAHASCMKNLDFQAFKSKTLLANAGSGAQVGGGGGGAKMEPIFTKITSEIKAVQITQNQYEQYISALKVCYETVLWDMIKDLDSMRSSFDQRLSKLERAVFLSEMRSNGVEGQHYYSQYYYDRLSKSLFWKDPLAAMSAFQLTAMPPATPEGSMAMFAGLAIFLILVLLRCLIPRRKSRGKGSPNMHGANSGKNGCSENTQSNSIKIPDRLSKNNEFLEKKNEELSSVLKETQGSLSNTNGQLSNLQAHHVELKQEHASLQQRYSRLEETVSALEGQITDPTMTPKRELKHVTILNGDCSTPTPSINSVPSVRSEPAASSETRITPTKYSLPRKKNLFGRSKNKT
mmetsp:Transcript_22658/g.54712  ORF Transcript_22658/g.54712 Transcript_22658/m.54712 type:complete len:1322 (+) Transcript_22658:45-4010(+)